MGAAKMTDVFQAVEEQAARGSAWDKVNATALLLAASLKRDEIDAIRAERWAMQQDSEREPNRNGALLTFDLHPLEYEACKLLCPDLKYSDMEGRRKAWEWILNQPWAEEFKASPFAKRYH